MKHRRNYATRVAFDIIKNCISVATAAHYLCGGMKVNLNAASSIHKLYAVGECSCTGLHGGNRLDLLYEETEELFKKSVVSRELCELRNVINVDYLIMHWVMERKKSRDLHYNVDHPRGEKSHRN